MKMNSKNVKAKRLTLIWTFIAGISIFALGSRIYSNITFIPKLDNTKLLKIHFLDVEQGDCCLAITPENKTFLIDAGPGKNSSIEDGDGTTNSNEDAGETVILPFLEKEKIDTIDYVILTHLHSDHYGGLYKILETVKVKCFIDTGFIQITPDYERLLDYIDKKKVQYLMSEPGKQIKEGDVRIEFLAPQTVYQNTGSDINNNSMVIKLVYNNNSVLFTGDIETVGELALTELGGKIKSTVLKIAHHGSWTSTTAAFLDLVNPQIAIISCGQTNPFEHPHLETIRSLKQHKVITYRTDIDGNISFVTDGEKYKVLTVNN